MATQFLDLTGLQRYDAKIKGVAAGSATISGRTITLFAIDGTQLCTIDVPQTVYDLATASKDGLLSADMFVKVEGISEGATKTEESATNGKLLINGQEVAVYLHPTSTALSTSAIYKITTDAEGHVKTGAAVTKADITALGIPAQDTTYEKATGTADGLMSKEHFTKVEGIAEGATKTEASATNGQVKIDGQDVTVYTHETFTERASGLYKITVNNEGHVSAATEVTKTDITALGIPGQDTTYDLATADKEGLQSAAHYTKVEGIEAGAQVNVLEKVSVNGSALTVNSKGVNIDLTGYALKSDIVGLYSVKGSVDNYSALPTDAAKGDVYNVINADTANNVRAGDNFVWTGTEWDNLGGVFTMDAISVDSVDALFA